MIRFIHAKRKFFLCFFTIVSALIFLSCKMQGTSTINTNTMNITLDTLYPSPQSEEKNWCIGDIVAIIDSAGNFKTSCTIEAEGFNMIHICIPYAKTKTYKWINADEKYQYSANTEVLTTMPHGYKIRIGTGRLAYDDWFEPKQIFPVPWQNNMQLKIGDSIYLKRYGNFEKSKGTITAVPGKAGGQFSINYDGYSGRYQANYEDVYTSIESATIQAIQPGDILYLDNMYWVMVVGTKDNSHVIVRSEGFPATDKIVPLSSLQILQ